MGPSSAPPHGERKPRAVEMEQITNRRPIERGQIALGSARQAARDFGNPDFPIFESEERLAILIVEALNCQHKLSGCRPGRSSRWRRAHRCALDRPFGRGRWIGHTTFVRLQRSRNRRADTIEASISLGVHRQAAALQQVGDIRLLRPYGRRQDTEASDHDRGQARGLRTTVLHAHTPDGPARRPCSKDSRYIERCRAPYRTG